MRIAAITMVRNERDYLPLWLAHYGREFGRDNLLVLDHGSTDGSTDEIGVNCVRLPADGLDDSKRSRFVSKFHAALLEYYDAAVYTDVDEFLVADPLAAPDLTSLFSSAKRPVIAGIGVDVVHVREAEETLNLHTPILAQREWSRFNPYYCKPAYSSVQVQWNPGFHSINGPFVMHQGLINFHLRSADWNIFVRRHADRQNIEMRGENLSKGIGNHFSFSLEKAASTYFFDNAITTRQSSVPEFGFRTSAYEWFTRREIKTPLAWPTAKIPERFAYCIMPAPCA